MGVGAGLLRQLQRRLEEVAVGVRQKADADRKYKQIIDSDHRVDGRHFGGKFGAPLQRRVGKPEPQQECDLDDQDRWNRSRKDPTEQSPDIPLSAIPGLLEGQAGIADRARRQEQGQAHRNEERNCIGS